MKHPWRALALAEIQSRIEAASAEMAAFQESLGSEAKSTAGDKHETGRAMIQREMERAADSLSERRRQLQSVQRIFQTERANDLVRPGHVVTTDGGTFLLGPALGKLRTETGELCFALSPDAPLGKALMGKAVGEVVALGSQRRTIQSID